MVTQNDLHRKMAGKVTPLIGFCGLARSGKDTAAEYLLRLYGMDVYSFAKPIKKALMAMFGFSYRHLEGDLKETDTVWLGKSPRELMQSLGTEWGRQWVCDDVWVRTLARELRGDANLCRSMGNVWRGAVISDVRLHNEAAWVRGEGGVVVHIQRPNARRVASHSTEDGVEVVAGDFVIVNDGSVDALYDKLDGMMAELNLVPNCVVANA